MSALFAAVWGVVAAAPVEAGTERVVRVAILPVVAVRSGASGSDDVVRAVSDVVSGYVRLEPMTVADLLTTDGVELTESATRCGADRACMTAVLARHGYAFGVVVAFNRRVRPPLLRIELVGGAAEVSGSLEVDPTGDWTAALAAAARRILDGAGFVREAWIVVAIRPADAVVNVDGTSRFGQDQLCFEVPPGLHSVRVTRYGFRPFVAERTLSAGERWGVDAHLVPEADAGAGRSLLASPWTWVAAAAVVAAAVTTAVIVTSSDPGYCVRLGTSADCP